MRIVHLSDLHFGYHDPALAAGLAADIARQQPTLVVVSGDFTQRGTAREFAQARAFLDALPAPLFAVPGNHDMPMFNLWRRFTDPYRLYRRYIDDELEPFLEVDGIAIAGLKTSRRARAGLNWAHGSINRQQLKRLAQRFAGAPDSALRVVVAHHPLMGPEAPETEMRLVRRASTALRAFSGMGVRLVLSGHFHLSYVREHVPGEIRHGTPPGPRLAAVAPILVAQASTTISTRLRGHPNGYNLVDIAGDDIAITVRDWTGERWTTREEASARS